MTSVSAGHIILTPTQPVGSGRPQRESNPGPPHQESRALPTEPPRGEGRQRHRDTKTETETQRQRQRDRQRHRDRETDRNRAVKTGRNESKCGTMRTR